MNSEKMLTATIVSFLRYEDKDKKTGQKTGKEKVRIEYLLLNKDNFQERDKFVGYASLSAFVDCTPELWEKLNANLIMKPVEMVFESVPSMTDPFKSFVRLKAINSKENGSISLV